MIPVVDLLLRQSLDAVHGPPIPQELLFGGWGTAMGVVRDNIPL